MEQTNAALVKVAQNGVARAAKSGESRLLLGAALAAFALLRALRKTDSLARLSPPSPGFCLVPRSRPLRS
jgi:hypothetical protein